MARFVLTAQLQLTAPKNIGAVVKQIQAQLRGVHVNVEIRGASRANKDLKTLSTGADRAASSAKNMGKSFALSIKRFAAFSIATRAVGLITQGLGNAVAEAIKFEREMIKVSQVTGKSMAQLQGLSKTIRKLSIDLGVSSKELLSVARILAQTGLSARETEIALSALAKTQLAPTFENIIQTAEGAVAIINQFKQGVAALEGQLGSINAVAGQFAVEAGDLIAVIRRTGGVFKAAGGDLNELIALFTSVRATTRESAESIATGLRTIFTRIQRPKTIQYLKELGIELTDVTGKFVGPYEAVRRLHEALQGLEQGDLKFIEIAEQLGGFRQIGKVLPLLSEFAVAESALAAAMAGQKSLTDDAATAQQALAIRITQVKERFLELVSAVVQSPTFMIMANAALALAENLIKIADALKHLIPLLITLAGIKLMGGMAGFAAGMKGGMSKGTMKMARGGLVPGRGNRDTVPAVLTPGEFVVRKQSVAAIGAGRLQNMNRYAAGGKVSAGRHAYGAPGLSAATSVGMVIPALLPKDKANPQAAGVVSGTTGNIPVTGALGNREASVMGASAIGGASLYEKWADQYKAAGIKPLKARLDKTAMSPQVFGKNSYSFSTITEGVTADEWTGWKAAVDAGIKSAVGHSSAKWASSIGVTLPPLDIKPSYVEHFPKGFLGTLFEGVLDAFNSQPLTGAKGTTNLPFDYTPQKPMKPFGTLFQQVHASGARYIDAKVSRGQSDANFSQKEYYKKAKNQLSLDMTKSGLFAKAANSEIASAKATESAPASGPGGTAALATGGSIRGTDTVPALLTPGEFVVNKRSAQSIGYGNLSRINRYAAGGKVTAGRHAYGSMDTIGGGMDPQQGGGGDGSKAGQAMKKMVPHIEKVTAEFQKMVPHLEKLSTMFGTTLLQSAEKVANFLNATALPAYEKVANMVGVTVLGALERFAAILTSSATPLGALVEGLLGVGGSLTRFMTALNEVATVVAGGFGTAILTANVGMTNLGRIAETAGLLINNLSSPLGQLKTGLKQADVAAKQMGKSGASVKGVKGEFTALMEILAPLIGEFGKMTTTINTTVLELGKLIASLAQTIQGAIKTNSSLQWLAFRSSEAAKQLKLLANAAKKTKSTPTTGGGADKKMQQATAAATMQIGKMASMSKIAAMHLERLGVLVGLAGGQMEKVMIGLGMLAAAEDKATASTTKSTAAEDKDTSSTLKHSGAVDKSSAGLMRMLGPLMAIEMLLGMMSGALDETTSKAGLFAKSMIKGISVFVMLFMVLSMIPIPGMMVVATDEAKAAAALTNVAATNAESVAKMSSAGKMLMFSMLLVAAGIAMKSYIDAVNKARVEAAQKGIEGGTGAAGSLVAAREGEGRGGMLGGIGLAGGIAAAVAAMGALAGPALAAATVALTGFAAVAAAAAVIFIKVIVVVGIIIAVLAAVALVFAIILKACDKLDPVLDALRNALSILTVGMVDSAEIVTLRAELEENTLIAKREEKKALESNTSTMKEFEAGTISATEALAAMSTAHITAGANQLEAQIKLSKELGASTPMRTFFSTITAGLVESRDEKTARVAEEQAPIIEKDRLLQMKQIESTNKGRRQAAKDEILGGGNKAGFMKESMRLAGGEESMRDLTAKQRDDIKKNWSKMYDNIKKQIDENIAKLKAMDFGLRGVTAATGLASVRMKNFTNSLEVGFSPLENSLNTLTSILEGTGMALTDAEIDKALAEVTDAMKAFGGDAKKLTVFSDTIKGFNTIAQDFEKNSDKVMANLISKGKGKNLDEIEDLYKDEMEKSLQAANISPEAIKKIMDTVQLSTKQKERLQEGDTTVLEELTEEQKENMLKLTTEVNKIVDLQKVVVGLTKEKIKMERLAIAAEKKAIDLRLEAAEIIAKHGGKAVTAQIRRQAILDKANTGAGRLGLGAMGTGSVAEVRRRNMQISGRFAAAEIGQRDKQTTSRGLVGDVEGTGRRDDLMKAQQDHVKMIKDLIKVEEEELKLIEKKNDLEKKSLEQLLKGDLEGFLKDQAAVGATAAVATGSTGLMGLFGAEALGGAFTNIQTQANAGQQSLFGQQLGGAGGLVERAGGAALSARGMAGDRGAQMLAGTGAEAEARRQTIRDLAGELPAAGQTGVDMANMRVNTAKLNVQNAVINVVRAVSDAGTSVAQGGARGIARGGMIYANNGMFVPRGTDTVPAMLTPGEFVVNRQSVNRGNNLQMLQAMNGIGYAQGGQVGQVQYLRHGSRKRVSGGGGGGGWLDPALVASLTTSFTNFNAALTKNIDRLEKTKFHVKLDPTMVIVKLDDNGMLADMKESIKSELLAETAKQLNNQTYNLAGEPTQDPSVVKG